ncbi:hypothetical protein QBC33DRAFT_535856 [Phialemonium atrogriseum]|uniref:Uncharacterized protein n=1 Tax=Phialemonium atrogriseum TaxID=1093897 RepID=A0AAJ0C3E8_9PEZI|nr:uncharacterized protein QBC33DRAFT_535856 [Phialemonium atrogriseum]KAK1767977.1 hypothetical protein QBC33DRAFT_535856 [Phialemonium atrogriseum]
MVLSADAEQLREAEVLAARAYTCCVCLAAGAAERVSFALCGHGVWGYEEEAGELSAAVPDGEGVVRGGFMGSPTPVWGCGCAKLLSTMCQAHRLMHAELWLTQVRLMNEWIVGKYGRKVCPLCHVKGRPAVNEFNFEGQLGGEGVDKLAWACVSCQEFVVVPRNLGKGLLPGIETMVIDVNSYYRRSSEIYTSGTREGWVPQM